MTAGPAAPDRKPRPPGGATAARTRIGPAEAAVFETFVVPRYLSLFGELALELLLESEQARVVHLGCRTGYPDRGIALKLPGAHVVGVDSSVAALQLARAKAATMSSMVADYRFCERWPAPLPDSAFSHGLTLHPSAARGPEELDALVAELARLLAPNGQLLVALPVRGSFQELIDLLREYVLKLDDAEVGRAVEKAAVARPTIEALTAQVERAGFDFVDVTLRPTVLRFRSGRDFFEDPAARFLVLPDVPLHPRADGGADPFTYVRDAIDQYWSESAFELTVNVACVTARRV